jgi:hypothetical protein
VIAHYIMGKILLRVASFYSASFTDKPAVLAAF